MMTKQIYIGEYITPWRQEQGYQTRMRWGLFVPAKQDGTPDKRSTPRAGRHFLFERSDYVARLYENNMIVEERRDSRPGAWDISKVSMPLYGTRSEGDQS